MNDDIKKILEKMFLNCDTQEEKNKVLDYITNLQHTKEYLGEVLYEKDKELEKLNNKIKHYEETTTFGDYVKEVNLLIDYKSRCEKAVEYIKINFIEDIITVKTLLNILEGRRDE